MERVGDLCTVPRNVIVQELGLHLENARLDWIEFEDRLIRPVEPRRHFGGTAGPLSPDQAPSARVQQSAMTAPSPPRRVALKDDNGGGDHLAQVAKKKIKPARRTHLEVRSTRASPLVQTAAGPFHPPQVMASRREIGSHSLLGPQTEILVRLIAAYKNRSDAPDPWYQRSSFDRLPSATARSDHRPVAPDYTYRR